MPQYHLAFHGKVPYGEAMFARNRDFMLIMKKNSDRLSTRPLGAGLRA